MGQHRDFNPARHVRSARLLPGQPGFIKRSKPKGAMWRGVKFELEVREYLQFLLLGNCEVELLLGPWIEFQDASGKRWCQPDALLLHQSSQTLIIAEIKYQHCAEAWWQLTQLYDPVCKVLFPEIRRFGLLEIVSWHDPSTQFPGRYNLTDNPLAIRDTSAIAVHIYSPRLKRHVKAGFGDSENGGKEASARRLPQGA